MTRLKIFAALILLILLFTIVAAQIAKAAPIENIFQTDAISCNRPTSSEAAARCADIEDQILDTTIRIVLHTRRSSNGISRLLTTESHGTIFADRYLVTHNHYQDSIMEQVEDNSDQYGYTAISLYTSDGGVLLENESLNSFTIQYEDEEVLVLTFVNDVGVGLFEAANLPSAEFTDWDSSSFKEGDELAQIDWDGKVAHVDWVRIETLSLNNEVPQLWVNNYLKKGSSGGGVFLDGVHIGNNWMRITIINKVTGEITGRYSTVALNSLNMLDVNP